MNTILGNTRRQLGELGAMSAQTDAMERKILHRSIDMLSDVEGKLEKARADAMHGDDAAKDRYTHLVEERGRLEQVIAQAHAVLAS